MRRRVVTGLPGSLQRLLSGGASAIRGCRRDKLHRKVLLQEPVAAQLTVAAVGCTATRNRHMNVGIPGGRDGEWRAQRG